LKAKEAGQVQGLIGNPFKSNFKGMVRGNMIRNFLAMPNDVANAQAIFRPDHASIRGKTVRRTPAPVVADYVDVSRSIVQNKKVVMMVADMYFVDGTAFLITISWQISS
jgi:hypothetical protein